MPPQRTLRSRTAKKKEAAAKQNEQIAKQPEVVMAIGLDFGTTNSGFAYGLTGDQSIPGFILVDVIMEWHSYNKLTSERTSQKVPSRLHYDKQGALTWGHNIPKHARVLQWFKLLLLREDELPDYLRNSAHLREARALLQKLGTDAITVTADYLKLFWDHCIMKMKESKGKNLVEEATFQVSFTVPAIWSDTARKNLAEAVKRAGILDDRLPSSNNGVTPGKTTVKYISEPEAAAFFVLESQLGYRPDLKKGDRFMVVDCGGGTVDIICYEVVEPAPKLKIRECTEGTGDLCGATFLDQAFREYLVGTVGKSTWDALSPRQKIDIMEATWEDNIKPDFTPDVQEAGAWPVNIPGQQEPIYLNSDEIRDVFQDSVITRIQGLVRAQINKMKVQQGIENDEVTPKLLLPQRNESWSAVCQGAAMARIREQSLVVTRKARSSIGYPIDEPWDRKKHVKNVTWEKFDKAREMRMAEDQMRLVQRAGDDVSTENEPAPYDLAFTMDESGPAKKEVPLYKALSRDPPPQLEPDDTSWQHVGDIKMEFPVHIEDIPAETNMKGRPVRMLVYDSHTNVNGAGFEFQAFYNGEVVGQYTVTSDADDSLFVD
ncbi:actin-like ATPase domain-containing protein [Apiospora marii]|uniref:actin-like ATPase domain-containing protein n=1 Tax=Apiospora marii TaxID=335849 RepID=UPI003130B615